MAMRTIGVVYACATTSSRREQQGKLSRRLGGKSLLEWVVRRMTDCERLQAVVVAASNDADLDELARLVPSDVPIIGRKAADSLSRFLEAADKYQATGIVRVGADQPFVDPELVDRLVTTAAEHPTCDYVGYCTRHGKPAVHSTVGVFAEWYRVEALRTVDREMDAVADRDQLSRWLLGKAEQYQARLIPVPTELDCDDVRLRVDSEEDWEHALAIIEALGADDLEWQRIAGLLRHQPALRRRMEHLNRLASVA